jgi:hypothetical protein
VLAAGCQSKHSTEHVEVTGRVLYNNEPVTGGQVSFVTVESGFANTGRIDEQGNYTIKAPVGEVMISVDNRMLREQPIGDMPAMRMGAGRPDQPKPDPIKGTYVQIPAQYYTPDVSGLKYTVPSGPGPHKYDIVLRDLPQ